MVDELPRSYKNMGLPDAPQNSLVTFTYGPLS